MNSNETKRNELAMIAPQGGGMLTTFKDLEQMYKFADFLSKSPLLPTAFQNNAGSVMIALNMAQRLRMDPLMVCQNIVIVHGNAGLSGKMAIALLNRSPKYRRIEYRYVNGKDYTGGIQVVGHRVDDTEDKNPDYGTPITLDMARSEGWTSNKKWQTMPEQMMRYRAAAFFARAFVPEELLGMQTAEELEDVSMNETPETRNVTPKGGLKLAKPAAEVVTNDATEVETNEAEVVTNADEESEKALVWLDNVLKENNASWTKVYRICDAIGLTHPRGGASRAEMAAFAASVFSDDEVRKAMDESGIKLQDNDEKKPVKTQRGTKKKEHAPVIQDESIQSLTDDDVNELFSRNVAANDKIIL